MIALLLAAAVTGQPLPQQAEHIPNAFHEPANCPSVIEREVRRQQVALRGRSAGLQYAVMRKLDGCMVPAPVGYHPDYLSPGADAPAARPGDEPGNRR